MKKISRNYFRFVQSLRHKKYRVKERCFLVEGEKSVDELLNASFDVVVVVCTAMCWSKYEKRVARKEGLELCLATTEEMMQLGSLQSNNSVIAAARQLPDIIPETYSGRWLLALDNIRDPGNLGTIIRTADWFDVRRIVASSQTVEYYNPKVVHATMGSFTRVQIGYTALEKYLASTSLPVYGLFMQGKPIGEINFEREGVLVVGNESNGISTPVEEHIDYRVGIPRLGGAASLNAAIAVGIALYNATLSQRG